MKILYNDKEVLRYANRIAFIIFIAYTCLSFVNYGIDYLMDYDYIIKCALWIIAELIIGSIWYPDEIKRKKAIKKGDILEGKIVDILYKKRKRFVFSKDYNGYSIVIEVVLDEGKTNIEFGEYSINPGDFVSVNEYCTVYRYNNKFYLDTLKKKKRRLTTKDNCQKYNDFYPSEKEMQRMANNIKYPIEKIMYLDETELQKAIVERQNLSLINSSKYIFVSPNYFKYNLEFHLILLTEIHIESKIKINEYSLGLGEFIQKYMDDNQIVNEGSDDVYINNLKGEIKNYISRQNKKIHINDIVIVMI